MGKNGAALREAKANNQRYYFTRETLAQHDHLVRVEYKKRCEIELKAAEERYKKSIAEAKQDMYKEIGERYERNFYDGYRYFCCKLIPILVNNFNFPRFKGHENRLTRLLGMLMGAIECPDHEEVEEMCDKIYKEYGLYFGWNEPEEEK